MNIFDQLVDSMTLSNWLSVAALVISLLVGLSQMRQRRQQIKLQEQLLQIQMEEAARKTFSVEVARPRALRNGKESSLLIVYPIFGLTIPSDCSTHPDQIQFDLVLRNGSALPVYVEDIAVSGVAYESQSGNQRLLNSLFRGSGAIATVVPLTSEVTEQRFQLQIADPASGNAITPENGLRLEPGSVSQLRLTLTPLPALIERLDHAKLGITGLMISVYLADGASVTRSVSLPEAWKGEKPWWPLGAVHLIMKPSPQRHVFYEKLP